MSVKEVNPARMVAHVSIQLMGTHACVQTYIQVKTVHKVTQNQLSRAGQRHLALH